MDSSQQQGDTINLMDSVLASQVAAGEVVERPASVIKELVENSIDAGAHVIRVDVARGGLYSMRVSDDGMGMSRKDAQMCLLRHATSKLHDFEQLFNIQQMGFRGEAIPSIASVSQFTITTRREDDVEGTRLHVEAGIAQDPQSAGCQRGTTIEVRELFFNTPARRKFLKSPETELAHIEHQLMLHALCYPAIRFIFESDTARKFDTAATSDLRLRIADFYGKDLADKLIKMSLGEAPGVSVCGYLLPLAEAKRNKKMQYVFLNGRPIEDKMVLRAVRDGYGGLPTGLHPVLFLYLQVDPGLVDINVHPAKKEVRFRRLGDVCTAVMDAVAASLSQYAKQAKQPQSVTEQGADVKTPASPRLAMVEPPARIPALRPLAPRPLLPPTAIPKPSLKPLEAPCLQTELEIDVPATQAPAPIVVPDIRESLPSPKDQYAFLMAKELKDVPHFRLVGTLQDSFAIFENKEGMVLLSPRAARERLIFERLMRGTKKTLASQQLLLPVLLELDARDMAAAQELKPQLEKSGFRTSLFGRSTLRVESIPAMLPIGEVESFMMGIIDLFSTRGELRLARSHDPYQLFVMHLAKQYAKLEDVSLLLANAMLLLSDLLSCEVPYCTPSGKPTLFPLSLNEIKRKFNAN